MIQRFFSLELRRGFPCVQYALLSEASFDTCKTAVCNSDDINERADNHRGVGGVREHGETQAQPIAPDARTAVTSFMQQCATWCLRNRLTFAKLAKILVVLEQWTSGL